MNTSGKLAVPPIPHSYNDAPRIELGLLHPDDGNAMGHIPGALYLRCRWAISDEMKHIAVHRHPIRHGREPTLTTNPACSNLASKAIGLAVLLSAVLSDANLQHRRGRLRSTRQHAEDAAPAGMQWNFNDQLQMTQRQKVNDQDADGVQRHGERTWYVYDASGQRIRKVTELANGQVKDERLYLGGFEVYRRHGANPPRSRDAAHHGRQAAHRTGGDAHTGQRTWRAAATHPLPVRQPPRLGQPGAGRSRADHLLRGIYALRQHLVSGRPQPDRDAKAIPLYSKERDEESGFYYHGARYYAPWLGRWTNTDPIGVKAGINVYTYVRNNPIRRNDPLGTQEREAPHASFGLRLDTGGNLKLGPLYTPSLCDELNPACGPLLKINLSGTEREFRTSVSVGDGGQFDELGIALNAEDLPSDAHTAPQKRLTQKPERSTESKKPKPIGAYLPGTEAGEEAAMYYAKLVLEGERQGGFGGFMKQVGGWAGGLFASLWTPETAVNTAITLGTAGIGTWAQAGRLGAASVPVMRAFQITGSFQGGVSLGEAATGTSIFGEELSGGQRALRGAFGVLTALTLFGGVRGPLFGRGGHFGTGGRPGFFNRGALRLGWSFRGQNLPGGGRNYFSFHGGGTFQGVNQGPHWHLYLNRFGWPSGPGPAPFWATGVLRGAQALGIGLSSAYGFDLGSQYLGTDED